jgi:hypothetical protein
MGGLLDPSLPVPITDPLAVTCITAAIVGLLSRLCNDWVSRGVPLSCRAGTTLLGVLAACLLARPLHGLIGTGAAAGAVSIVTSVFEPICDAMVRF